MRVPPVAAIAAIGWCLSTTPLSLSAADAKTFGPATQLYHQNDGAKPFQDTLGG